MAKTKQKLTPVTDQTPAVVNVVVNELSGKIWVNRFPGSRSTKELEVPFRDRVEAFVGAIEAGGANVSIAATFRPVERAYMMHWSWKIVKQGVDPKTIPALTGVAIEWSHKDEKNEFSKELSEAGAQEMVDGFDIQNLKVAPALASQHTVRLAVDMGIKWKGTLTVIDAYGETVEINTEPRTEMNSMLRAVGRSYGVIKFYGGETDKPHWSSTGG